MRSLPCHVKDFFKAVSKMGTGPYHLPSGGRGGTLWSLGGSCWALPPCLRSSPLPPSISLHLLCLQSPQRQPSRAGAGLQIFRRSHSAFLPPAPLLQLACWCPGLLPPCYFWLQTLTAPVPPRTATCAMVGRQTMGLNLSVFSKERAVLGGGHRLPAGQRAGGVGC